MKTHSFAAAVVLTLAFSTLAQAAPSMTNGSGASKTVWTEPPQDSGATKPATPLYDPADPDAVPSKAAPSANTEPPVGIKEAPASTASVQPEPAPKKPAGYRTAKYSGGEGSTWKSGRNGHNFMGTFGGCTYRGFAGPNGYKIDRSC